MEELLGGAVAQYIDGDGKCRALIYKGFGSRKLVLMISPLPPVDLPMQTLLPPTGQKRAMQFIRSKELSVSGQRRASIDSDAEIEGIWVEPSSTSKGLGRIYYGYIPIEKSPSLEDVNFRDEDPPLVSSASKSLLEETRSKRKIAIFLKNYVLYTYALSPEKFGDEKSGDFGKEMFKVSRDHQYNISSLHKSLYVEGNGVIYSRGRMIVTSKEMRSRLIAYLKVCLINDRQGVLKMATKRTIDDYYESIIDFRSNENQLIFDSQQAVTKWREELERSKNMGEVYTKLLVSTLETPYYYRNFLFDSTTPAIVQNVKDGDLELAITVAHRWLDDKVNLGFSTPAAKDVKSISYSIYNPNTGNSKDHHHTSIEKAKVVDLGDDKYAALLFF